MTTLAAILALLPLALSIGQGAAMLQPLAIAIIAGLIVQLPLVLSCACQAFWCFSKWIRESQGMLFEKELHKTRRAPNVHPGLLSFTPTLLSLRIIFPQ